MAVDGPGFADVSSLSDDVTIDGESVYSQPSVISHHSSRSQGSTHSSSVTYSAHSGHSHSASYSGSLKSTNNNYSYLKPKRRTPPLVAPRPHHYGSLKRLDRLPPPYARPSSAGPQDDFPEPGIVKARSTTFNGETFTSKLTVIPDSSQRACSQIFGAQHFGNTGNFQNNNNNINNSYAGPNYQTPFSPKFLKTESACPSQRGPPGRFDDHVYEDPELCTGPAKLPPESGMLSKNQSKVVLRPLAFKPVMQHPPKPMNMEAPSYTDEGYHSTEFRQSRIAHDYQDGHTGRVVKPDSRSSDRHDSRPGSFNSSGHSRMSSGHTETFLQTPSPSDSGVSELEAILREKDAEILHLRETMEGNERAIFQVFDEKKRCWQNQMDNMIQDYEEKLRVEKQKAFKSEQSLLMQMVKLQQDKKNLTSDTEAARASLKVCEDRCAGLEKELAQAKSKNEESNWALHQKTGELVMVKSQLKDSKEESQQRYVEISGLRSKVAHHEQELADTKSQLTKLQDTFNEGKRQLQRSCQELDRLGLDKNQSFELHPGDRIANCDSDDEKDSNSAFHIQEIKRLKNEFEKFKAEKRQMMAEFEEEKSQWLDEKNKVICYQKQLQLNYVQMLRKNKTLEEEVEQLMLDLERTDMKMPDSSC